PDHSWPRVIGVASCMWVRPILMMFCHSLALAVMAVCSWVIEGMRRWAVPIAAAMHIAEGKLSFDDCDMLTWSLGCTGALLPRAVPANWQARLEKTSLTFMLNWVPLPVIQTWSGNMS